MALVHDFRSLIEGGGLWKDHLILAFGIYSSRILFQIEDYLNQFIQVYNGQVWGWTLVYKPYL